MRLQRLPRCTPDLGMRIPVLDGLFFFLVDFQGCILVPVCSQFAALTESTEGLFSGFSLNLLRGKFLEDWSILNGTSH